MPISRWTILYAKHFSKEGIKCLWYLFGVDACSSSVGGSKNLGVIRRLPSAVLVSICLSIGPLTTGGGGGLL